MALQDLLKQGQTVDTSLDNVIIQKNLETVPGGRTLDVTGFPDSYIQAGHVIAKDSAGEYVPLPVDGLIPAGASVVGILSVSISADSPEAAIMTRGTVNEVQLAYPIAAAVKAELPGIQYAVID